MCKTCKHRFDCTSDKGGSPCYQVDIDAYRKAVRKQTVEDIIKFIEKWRDRQNCIGRKVVNLIANEIIDSIKNEFLESEDK